MSTTETVDNTTLIANALVKVGAGLIILALTLFTAIFWRVGYEELSYRIAQLLRKPDVVVFGYNVPTSELAGKEVLVPVDRTFAVVIPKIRANARVIKDVNPNDPTEYQAALTKGIAHARGSSYPDQLGNVFLFAHSSNNFYDANRYNSIFYLLNKLENGDTMLVLYNDLEYKYIVTEVKVVDPAEVKYIIGDPSRKTLTLMTCWPAGTMAKRMLVIGSLID